jgi:hypothetical protein
MYHKLKKIVALLMSVAIFTGSFATLALGVYAAEEEYKIEKGEFTYAPHTYTDGDLTDIYYYTDGVFTGSATDYNEHLATMSMILAAASISSQDADASYGVKSHNLIYLFREWDFTGYEVNEHYTQKPGEQTMGVGMAYKVIGEGEDAYTLLAIVPRSAGYEKEWAGNFTVGKEGVHQGFATGRDIILEFAKQYVANNAELFEGAVKVWTVGYSRGAGVANLLAAYLTDNNEALGVRVEKENIFAYTFGTPSTVPYSSEAEQAALESNYQNIHNRYAVYDIVTYAPFKNWNFTCYGTSTLFDVENAENKAEMLTFLEKTNKTIYDMYTAENSSADPDNFAPLMLKVDINQNGLGIEFVPADPAYGIPATQQEFLDSRIEFLTKNLVPNRETYVDGGYEYAMQCLTSLYFGLDAEQSALLIAGMSHDVKMLAAAYYCYYVADYYLASEALGESAVSVLLNALPTLEEIVAEIEASDVFGSTEWGMHASAFVKSESYLQMKSLLQTMAADPESMSLGMTLVQDTLKGFVAGMTGKVLGSGVNALTIDEEEKAKLYETMTSEAVTIPLTEFFVYLLLGSDEGAIAPFDPSNKNIALAVTFLSNAGRYMRAHNNEIILSWLRTEDSYYDNETWHVHETELLGDADGHFEKCECGYEGEKTPHIFSQWSTLPVTNGEKKEVVRRCYCGYEEFKEAENVVDDHASKTLEPMTIVVVCVGGVLIVAASVTVAVIIKKKKAQA